MKDIWLTINGETSLEFYYDHTQTYFSLGSRGKYEISPFMRETFHLGLTLPLWGRICKWYTNELKVFSLWELINQGAPLPHIYIFLKSSQGSRVTNYSAFPGQLHWTSAPLSSSEHHTCIFAPFIFSRVLQAKGFSREMGTRGNRRSQGTRVEWETDRRQNGVIRRNGQKAI